MKTLDEVIEAIRIKSGLKLSSRKKDDRWEVPVDLYQEIIYYLKEYSDKAHKLDIDIAEHHRTFEQLGIEIARYQKAKAEMEEISADYVALKQWWAEQQENPPLSWDELKQMEGKPVWVEVPNHDIWEDPSHRVDSEWWVIGEVRKDDIILATYLDEMELLEDDLGVIWKAYRKEPIQ